MDNPIPIPFFDINLSGKINLPHCGIPINRNFVSVNPHSNFGDFHHDHLYCQHFSFRDPTHHLTVPIVNEQTNSFRDKKLTRLRNQLTVLQNGSVEKQLVAALKTSSKDQKITIQKKLDNLRDKDKFKTKILELKTKIANRQDNSDKCIQTKHIPLCPTKTQVVIFKNWFDECTKVYNKCVKVYKTDNTFFDNGYMNAKLKIFEKLYGDDDKPCPYDILTDEIKSFCSNLQSCRTNLERGNINHFEMKPKRIVRPTHYIFVPKSSVKNGFIYKTHLGKTIGFDEETVEADCKIFYDRVKNMYKLLVPIYVDKEDIEKREKIVALDPGEKIFMTYYGENNFGHIGKDIRIKILKEEGKIRKFQRILSKGVNKNGEKLQKKNILKKIRKVYKKIQNIVKELHNKTALYLCKNYEVIMIPEFETQKMVKKKKKKKELKKIKEEEGEEKMKEELKKITRGKRLSGRVKFVLMMLSHYKFRERLKNKAEEYRCEVKIVTEEYTSKMCTKCGHISNKYNGREKECEKCKYRINRDINGARNILLVNYVRSQDRGSR